ncbi:MAG TPA: hypothetical protein VFX98_07520 [Longimicrobiaceae bacterium]|nr:hypothetical protein [Longimicrobiaceae bacterium]
MADINVEQKPEPQKVVVHEDYETWEIILWLLGVLSIPMVPIIMVSCFAPYSGM